MPETVKALNAATELFHRRIDFSLLESDLALLGVNTERWKAVEAIRFQRLRQSSLVHIHDSFYLAVTHLLQKSLGLQCTVSQLRAVFISLLHVHFLYL
jgi:hypothetical protein